MKKKIIWYQQPKRTYLQYTNISSLPCKFVYRGNPDSFTIHKKCNVINPSTFYAYLLQDSAGPMGEFFFVEIISLLADSPRNQQCIDKGCDNVFIRYYWSILNLSLYMYNIPLFLKSSATFYININVKFLFCTSKLLRRNIANPGMRTLLGLVYYCVENVFCSGWSRLRL
jgi:hypothetical protein